MPQDRLGTAKSDSLNGSQKETDEWLTAKMKSYFGAELNDIFRIQTEDGGWLGPLPALIKYPSLAKPYFELLSATAKLSEISPEVRETAILTVGAIYKCGYELYSHKLISRRQTKLTDKQIDVLSSKPEQGEGLGLSDDCEVTRAVTIALAANKGPLAQDLFDRATKSLGMDQAIAVVNFVGIYAYTCILLNAIDASVPGSGESDEEDSGVSS